MSEDRWRPTLEQISLCLDCAVARVPLGKAAELVGVGGPDTLWLFAKQVGLRIFGVWEGFPACAVAARTAETPVPVHSGIHAQEGGS
jgi:hypothetical protein